MTHSFVLDYIILSFTPSPGPTFCDFTPSPSPPTKLLTSILARDQLPSSVPQELEITRWEGLRSSLAVSQTTRGCRGDIDLFFSRILVRLFSTLSELVARFVGLARSSETSEDWKVGCVLWCLQVVQIREHLRNTYRDSITI